MGKIKITVLEEFGKDGPMARIGASILATTKGWDMNEAEPLEVTNIGGTLYFKYVVNGEPSYEF